MALVSGVGSTSSVTSDIAATVAVASVGSCNSGAGSSSFNEPFTVVNPNANAAGGAGVCGAPPLGWGGANNTVARKVLVRRCRLNQ